MSFSSKQPEDLEHSSSSSWIHKKNKNPYNEGADGKQSLNQQETVSSQPSSHHDPSNEHLNVDGTDFVSDSTLSESQLPSSSATSSNLKISPNVHSLDNVVVPDLTNSHPKESKPIRLFKLHLKSRNKNSLLSSSSAPASRHEVITNLSYAPDPETETSSSQNTLPTSSTLPVPNAMPQFTSSDFTVNPAANEITLIEPEGLDKTSRKKKAKPKTWLSKRKKSKLLDKSSLQDERSIPKFLPHAMNQEFLLTNSMPMSNSPSFSSISSMLSIKNTNAEHLHAHSSNTSGMSGSDLLRQKRSWSHNSTLLPRPVFMSPNKSSGSHLNNLHSNHSDNSKNSSLRVPVDQNVPIRDLRNHLSPSSSVSSLDSYSPSSPSFRRPRSLSTAEYYNGEHANRNPIEVTWDLHYRKIQQLMASGSATLEKEEFYVQIGDYPDWIKALITIDTKSLLSITTMDLSNLGAYEIRSAVTIVNPETLSIELKINSQFMEMFAPSDINDIRNSRSETVLKIRSFIEDDEIESVNRFYQLAASILLHANLKTPGLKNKVHTPYRADFLNGKSKIIMEDFVTAFLPDLTNFPNVPSPSTYSQPMEKVDSSLLDDTFPACTAAGCAASPYNNLPWQQFYAILYGNGDLELKSVSYGSGDDKTPGSPNVSPTQPSSKTVGDVVYRIPVGHLYSSGIRNLDHSVYDIKNAVYIGPKPRNSEKFAKKLVKMTQTFKPNPHLLPHPSASSSQYELSSGTNHNGYLKFPSQSTQGGTSPFLSNPLAHRHSSVSTTASINTNSKQHDSQLGSTPTVLSHHSIESLKTTSTSVSLVEKVEESKSKLPKPVMGTYPTFATQPPIKHRSRHKYSLNDTHSYAILHFGADSMAAKSWFSALKTLSRLEIFSPSDGDLTKSFRISRSITFRVFEAKLDPLETPTVDNTPSHNSRSKLFSGQNSSGVKQRSVSAFSGTFSSPTKPSAQQVVPVPIQEYPDSYVEIYFGNRVWSRTSVASSSRIPFWREDYTFKDFPGPDIPNFYLMLRQRLGPRSNPQRDPALGYICLTPTDIRKSENVEKWYAFTPFANAPAPMCHFRASLYLKITYEELTVGSAPFYSIINQTLKALANTNWARLMQADDRRDVSLISETCLELCLSEPTSESAIKWIKSLITEEIKKIRINTIERSGDPLFFTKASAIDDSSNNKDKNTEPLDPKDDPQVNEAEKRFDDLKRNLGNTLFRGNSILTKSLERYMRIVGSSLLEKTVGAFVRQLVSDAPDLEVDPSRVSNSNHSTSSSSTVPNTPSSDVLEIVESHQQSLYDYTGIIWSLIQEHSDEIPIGFKHIFSHLALELKTELCQSEASVYNAVAGFLFLRFFCPGILNPKLFGLIRSQQVNKVQRSLTLVTKMVQCFANRTRFGFKEPWMIPMNSFFEDHEKELYVFFENILKPSDEFDFGSSNQHQMASNTTSLISHQASKYFPFYQYDCHPLAEDFNNPFLIDRTATIPKLIELWKASYCTADQLQKLTIQRDLHFQQSADLHLTQRNSSEKSDDISAKDTKSSDEISRDDTDSATTLSSSGKKSESLESFPSKVMDTFSADDPAQVMLLLKKDSAFLKQVLPYLHPVIFREENSGANLTHETIATEAEHVEALVSDISKICNYIDDAVRRLRIKLEIQKENFKLEDCTEYSNHIVLKPNCHRSHPSFDAVLINSQIGSKKLIIDETSPFLIGDKIVSNSQSPKKSDFVPLPDIVNVSSSVSDFDFDYHFSTPPTPKLHPGTNDTPTKSFNLYTPPSKFGVETFDVKELPSNKENAMSTFNVEGNSDSVSLSPEAFSTKLVITPKNKTPTSSTDRRSKRYSTGSAHYPIIKSPSYSNFQEFTRTDLETRRKQRHASSNSQNASSPHLSKMHLNRSHSEKPALVKSQTNSLSASTSPRPSMMATSAAAAALAISHNTNSSKFS